MGWKWSVPLTQIVPVGLSTRWHSVIHSSVNSRSCSHPLLLSQSPLSTLTIRPAWQVIPPLDSRYGGSVQMESNWLSGIFPRTSMA